MSKMGFYGLLHFFPFSWGKAEEERDEVGSTGDEIERGVGFTFQGAPLSSGHPADGVQ